MDKLRTLLAKYREGIMYLVFGVLTTAVNWLVYVAVTTALGLQACELSSARYQLIYSAGTVAGWVLSVLFAFFTNKKYVFRSDADRRTGLWRELGLFVTARVASFILFDLLLGNLLLLILPDFRFVITRDQWVKLLMNVLVVIFNYFASKLVIFKAGDGKAAGTEQNGRNTPEA